MNVPEWHFNRVTAALGVKSKDHLYLGSNKQRFEAELEAAQVASHPAPLSGPF